MRVDDFPFATQLANTMNWNMAPEDFQFMASLEPKGSFVVLDADEPIGIATCISFGAVGWFGNLIVKEKYRAKGAGSFLVKHAVNYLQNKGVKTIGLYAYPNLINFYGNLGFKRGDDFSLFHVEPLDSLAAENLPKANGDKFAAIATFDSQCFGGDRERLLESIILEKGNLSYYKSEDDAVVGYVAATVYETMAWIGPLICKQGQIDAAVSLLESVLSKLTNSSVYLVLPKKERALTKMLFSVGFKEDFTVSRMFLGPPVAKNCIYLAESLERG